MKVNVTLNDDLLAKIDSYAEENYMSRSGLISLACTDYLRGKEMCEYVKQMTIAMQQIADRGFVEPELREQLEMFLKLSQGTVWGVGANAV